MVERRADGTGRILSDVVLSQVADHAAFGGVVPEIAARAHVEALDGVVAAALREAGLGFADIDAVAATAGPGLIGGVIVGLTTAKAIALAAGKPLVAVNHLEGHALTARLTDGLAFPYLLLLVSGGHTQFLAVEGVGDYRRLGTHHRRRARRGLRQGGEAARPRPIPAARRSRRRRSAATPARFALPRPLIGRPGADFSFSGLKTALRLAAEAIAPLSDRDVADLCRLLPGGGHRHRRRPRRPRHGRLFAAPLTPADRRTRSLVVAGGVAANQAIRAPRSRGEAATAHGFRLVAPPPRLCADNAVMIAWAGAERLALGLDRSARRRRPGRAGRSTRRRAAARRRQRRAPRHDRDRSASSAAAPGARRSPSSPRAPDGAVTPLGARPRHGRGDQRAPREPALPSRRRARRIVPATADIAVGAPRRRDPPRRAGAVGPRRRRRSPRPISPTARRSSSPPRASSAAPTSACPRSSPRPRRDAVPAVLSGPSFAADVARGLPTAVTIAAARRARSPSTSAARSASAAFRPYAETDMIGVEIGGAVKNVLAIAAGIVAGRQARRERARRADRPRLRRAPPPRRGARRAARDADGPLRPRRPGAHLLRPRSRGISPTASRIGAGGDRAAPHPLVEGIETAAVARDLARRHRVEMPIVEAVAAILDGELRIDAAIEGLMTPPAEARGRTELWTRAAGGD